MISERRQIGVEGSLKQVDTEQRFRRLARQEYRIGANFSGVGLDDPDVAAG